MSIWLKDEKEINAILECQDADGEISTEDVLERASQKDSPIHNYFEWEESKAAREYNLIQARKLIRRVPITYVNSGGEEKTVPRLVNISSVREDKNVRGYVDIEVVTSDDEKKRYAIGVALKSIRRWQDIYDSYTELGGIINEKVVTKLEKEYV